ncbi:hypothetical protein [Algiphilus sp.]|uniref:hypothetical protein n=1 Tax=Algiphilus sp. TaxID=1872431 RepID=UPI0032EB252E
MRIRRGSEGNIPSLSHRWSLTCLLILAAGMQSAIGAEKCPEQMRASGFPEDAITVVNGDGQRLHLRADESQTTHQLALQLEEHAVTVAYPIAVILFRPAFSENDGSSEIDELLAITAQQVEIAMRAGADSKEMEKLRALMGASCIRRELVAMRPTEWQRRWHEPSRLQPGDIVFLPPRMKHVAVVGAVEQPGLQAYAPEHDARSYVVDAQYQRLRARLGDAKAYLPNGRVVPVQVASWNYERAELPPGSVIIVPPWKPE